LAQQHIIHLIEIEHTLLKEEEEKNYNASV